MMKFLIVNVIVVICWTGANAQYLRGQQQGAAFKVPAYRRLATAGGLGAVVKDERRRVAGQSVTRDQVLRRRLGGFLRDLIGVGQSAGLIPSTGQAFRSAGQAFRKFEKCMSDGPEQSCSRPVSGCYVHNRGDSFSDGFEAGCPLPTLSVGVDTDTARLTFKAGDLQADVATQFERQWKQSPLKNYLHIDATTSFSFQDDAELTFDGDKNWALTVPGVLWDFDAAVTLKASQKSDPCADHPDKCRVVLNKGKTQLVNTVLVAGPVPVHVLLKAEVYLKVTPKMSGEIASTLRVSLADDGVALLKTATLDLDAIQKAAKACAAGSRVACGGNALLTAEKMATIYMSKMKVDDLYSALVDKLIVQVDRTIKVKAEIELCIGVKLGFHLNGIGTEIDVPVCVTAVLEASSDETLAAEVTITQNKLDMNFSLALPDPNDVVDSACGFVNMAPKKVVTCSILASCFTNLVDDLCVGMSSKLSDLELEIEPEEPLNLLSETELYKGSVDLGVPSRVGRSSYIVQLLWKKMFGGM